MQVQSPTIESRRPEDVRILVIYPVCGCRGPYRKGLMPRCMPGETLSAGFLLRPSSGLTRPPALCSLWLYCTSTSPISYVGCNVGMLYINFRGLQGS
jgi:hypothetical protein